jgi:hypothetical protein
MAVLFLDTFAGSGPIDGRVSDTGHVWQQLTDSSGESGVVSVSGGVCYDTRYASLYGLYGLDGAARAMTNFPMQYNTSVEFGFYPAAAVDPRPTQPGYDLPETNLVLVGPMDPLRANLSDPWWPGSDGKIGIFGGTRWFFTEAGTQYCGFMLRIRFGSSLTLGQTTAGLPPYNSASPDPTRVLNKLRAEYISTEGVTVTRLYTNNIFIAQYSGSFSIADTRLGVALTGNTELSYLVVYDGVGAWDGSGPTPPGPDPYTVGWWRNLANCTQEST